MLQSASSCACSVVLHSAVLATLRRHGAPVCAGCKYGNFDYWDARYRGVSSDTPSSGAFSWYCGWSELQPFWMELVTDPASRVLVPGVGNDATIAQLYDAGWTDVTAFDYSTHAVEQACDIIGTRKIALRSADATALPYADASFDAVLDKGTLDAIGISGEANLRLAVAELARTMTAGGVVVSISRALEADMLRAAFEPARSGGNAAPLWYPLRDGSLHIAETGEASTDLAAALFAWQRTDASPSPSPLA